MVACLIACLATLVAALLTIGWRGDARAQTGGQARRVATTQPPNLGSEFFTLKTVITLPGSPLSSFDIVWLDPMMGLLLVTDRAKKAVQVIDTATNTVIRTLTGFVGLRTAPVDSGPNGVITVRHESWAGDGDGTVKVHDLLTGTLTNTVAIPGGSPTTRVDKLCFSPRDNVVLLANDREGLISFISTLTYQVLSQIKLDGIQSAVKATNGIKQCQWNRRTGKFNLAVPENNGTGNGLGAGVVLEISAKARTIDKVFVIPQSVCIGPQGLAIGPERQILLGCSNRGPGSIIIDDRDGSVIKSLPGHQGADEVWFNDGDSRYFIAESDNPAGPRVGVVDSILESNELDQISPIITTTDDHAVTADPVLNQVYVPIRNDGRGICAAGGGVDTKGCIAVFIPSLNPSNSIVSNTIDTTAPSTTSAILYTPPPTQISINVVDSPASPSTTIAQLPPASGFLLDDNGGYLLDSNGGKIPVQ